MRASLLIALTVLCMLIAGCAGMQPVPYDNVASANYVEVTLINNDKVTGTVLDAQPYQLVVRDGEGRAVTLNANEIRSVRRKPPVMDERGRGISEEEIAAKQSGKNTRIYGIGGGLLSLGASFFAGSMMSQSADDDGALMLGTTAAGGGLGTLLFLRAGKAQDREEAIAAIREERRDQPVTEQETGPTIDDLRERMTEEKKKQEALRKEREELLRRLEDKSRDD